LTSPVTEEQPEAPRTIDAFGGKHRLGGATLVTDEEGFVATG